MNPVYRTKLNHIGGITSSTRSHDLNSPWRSTETIVKELKEQAKEINYKEIVGDSRVVFFGENHSNSPIRVHIASYAKALREAGITHYAIEATRTEQSIQLLQSLVKGKTVDLSSIDLGPGSNCELAVRALAKEGIQVVPVDIDQSLRPSQEEREAYITKNILDIITSSPDTKVAVLIGAYHASKKEISNFPYTAKRVIDSGVPCRVINFAGGMVAIPTMLTTPARQASLSDSEFVLDMKRYSGFEDVPFGAGQTDFVIHLPQQRNTNYSSPSGSWDYPFDLLSKS